MANEGLWKQLFELDPQQTARQAACRYVADSESYLITLLNKEYVVDLPGKRVISKDDSSPAEFAHELCILAYLINAKDLPLAQKLTPPQSLRDGQFFFRGPHGLPTDKLEEVFGPCPEKVFDAMAQLGAKRQDFGDAAISLHVLPRIPLTMVIWRGDEEFPARASILFDQTAADQLPLDALWMAANVAVKALINAATENS